MAVCDGNDISPAEGFYDVIICWFAMFLCPFGVFLKFHFFLLCLGVPKIQLPIKKKYLKYS